jgi:hypothetical protein
VFYFSHGSAVLESTRGQKLANIAVEHFHEQLNNDRYDEIIGEADEGFSQAGKDDLLKFFSAVHAKLGDAGASSFDNINVSATPTRTFVTTRYSTAFSRGAATETFTWIKKAGALKLYGYNINSNALILN